MSANARERLVRFTNIGFIVHLRFEDGERLVKSIAVEKNSVDSQHFIAQFEAPLYYTKYNLSA